MALANTPKPGIEPSSLALLDHERELLAELIEFPKVGIGLAYALKQPPLCLGELLGWDHKPPGGLPCRHLALSGRRRPTLGATHARFRSR